MSLMTPQNKILWVLEAVQEAAKLCGKLVSVKDTPGSHQYAAGMVLSSGDKVTEVTCSEEGMYLRMGTIIQEPKPDATDYGFEVGSIQFHTQRPAEGEAAVELVRAHLGLTGTEDTEEDGDGEGSDAADSAVQGNGETLHTCVEAGSAESADLTDSAEPTEPASEVEEEDALTYSALGRAV